MVILQILFEILYGMPVGFEVQLLPIILSCEHLP
jgi:hypothetical protein